MPRADFDPYCLYRVAFTRDGHPDEMIEFGRVRDVIFGGPVNRKHARLVFGPDPMVRRRPASVCLPAGKLVMWSIYAPRCHYRANETHPRFDKAKFARARIHFAPSFRQDAAGNLKRIVLETGNARAVTVASPSPCAGLEAN